MRNRKLLTFWAGLTIAISCTPSLAQSTAAAYPTKPVTIVLPYLSGVSSDIETRLYMPRLIEGLGQQIIVDYKPGGGSSIGTIYVSKAAPDGYTMLYVTASFTVYPAFFPTDKLPYDPSRDFAPITQITKRDAMLLVHPSLGVKTFPEYIAYAKANPGVINFGTSGNGGILHIVGAWLHSATNTNVTFIPYKSVATMYLDLMAGRLAASPAIMFVGLPYVKSGKLIPVANMGAERSKYLPDLKTVAEYGVPGYDYVSWSGYLAPARTPEAIVNRLSAEFAKVAKAPEVIKKMDADGAEMFGSTPAHFGQVIATEAARWRRVVQENGIKLEE